jgi:hypothetical protein
MCIGWAVCIAMTACGIRKIEKARAAGLNTLAAKFVQSILWFGVSAAIMLTWIFAKTERQVPDLKDGMLFWAIPVFAALAQIFKSMFFRERWGDRAHRAFGFLAAGHVLFAYGITMMLVFDPKLTQGRVARRFAWEWPVFDDPDNEIPGTLALLAVGLHIYGMWNLFRGRKVSESSGSWNWAVRMAWILLLLPLSLVAWYCEQSYCAYVSELAAIWTTASAVIIGRLLAAIRSKGAPSIIRRMLVTLPLLAVASAITIAGGMYASAEMVRVEYRRVDNRIPYENQDWVWKLPEVIRGPFAHALMSQDYFTRENLLIAGLLPEEEIKAAALGAQKVTLNYFSEFSSARNLEYWLAWSDRNLEGVMIAARSVPPAADSRVTATQYDYCAGFVIGLWGTDDEIRKRLSGGYSADMIDGVLSSLSKEKWATFVAEVEAWLERAPRSDPTAWEVLVTCDGMRAQNLVMKLIETPSPGNAVRLLGSRKKWSMLQNCEAVAIAALNSVDVDIRKAALSNCYQMSKITAALPLCLTAAEGSLPKSDADEVRLAIRVLAQSCGKLCSRWDWWPASPITPLSPHEQAECRQIIELFRKAKPVKRP